MKYQPSSILFPYDQIEASTRIIESRLFEFANFLESKIVLLYVNADNEVATDNIIKRGL